MEKDLSSSSFSLSSFCQFCKYVLYQESSRNGLKCNRDSARVAPKVMFLTLLYWPMTSGGDVGDMAMELKPIFHYILLLRDRLASDTHGVYITS